MPEMQQVASVDDQDLVGASLCAASGPQCYGYSRLLGSKPHCTVFLIDSSGVPEALEQEWVLQRFEDVLVDLLSDAISWSQELEPAATADDILPGADLPVTLASAPRQRVRVQGVVSKVTRSRGDLSLSDGDLDALGWLDLDDE
jgi:hypothetical protein